MDGGVDGHHGRVSSVGGGVPAHGGGLGCFLVGATGALTADGQALLGSVTDTPYDVRLVLGEERPADGHAYLGAAFVAAGERSLRERGLVAVEVEGRTCRGVNEAGLALTEAGVFEAPAAGAGGAAARASVLDALDELLRTCASVAEAIAFLETFGPSAYATSLLLADAAAHIAQVELGARGTAVLARHSPANPGLLVAANCFLALDGTSAAALPGDPRNNNGCRLDRGRELGARLAGTLSPERLAQLLADHDNADRDPAGNPLVPYWGYSICNHGTRGGRHAGDGEDPAWGTVAAEIIEPAARRLWFAYGWPCGAAPEHEDQLLQERSWGSFAPFLLGADGEPGPYTTVDGGVTALGVRSTLAAARGLRLRRATRAAGGS